jgi:hypothetical protein
MIKALIKAQSTKVQRQLLRRHRGLTVGDINNDKTTTDSSDSEFYEFPQRIDDNRINQALLMGLKKKEKPPNPAVRRDETLYHHKSQIRPISHHEIVNDRN